MVLRSGNESIVLYNRGFILALYVVGWLLILGAIASLWGELFGAIGWGTALYLGMPSVLTAGLLFATARPFSRSFVAIGPEGVRLGLLKFSAGDPFGFRRDATWTRLQEQRFKWEEIGDIIYDSDKGVCRFRARNYTYELSDNNSPSPRTVAKLMAEKKGVQLPAQTLLVPPGERPPMPRLTQAEIMVGISLAMLGAVAAGGLWMYSQAEGPYSDAETGVLAMVGLLGVSLFVSAIVLAVVEVTHRL